jgi:hypothetical protein
MINQTVITGVQHPPSVVQEAKQRQKTHSSLVVAAQVKEARVFIRERGRQEVVAARDVRLGDRCAVVLLLLEATRREHADAAIAGQELLRGFEQHAVAQLGGRVHVVTRLQRAKESSQRAVVNHVVVGPARLGTRQSAVTVADERLFRAESASAGISDSETAKQRNSETAKQRNSETAKQRNSKGQSKVQAVRALDAALHHRERLGCGQGWCSTRAAPSCC